MRSDGGSSAVARLGKMLVAMVVILVIYGCGGMSGTQQGGMGNQDLKVWPKASYPPVYKAPNGDRIGDYPPYFYPYH